MKLEQQVCSLELSQKLKELGVKQESYFWWVRPPYEKNIPHVLWGEDKFVGGTKSWKDCSSFTVAELGEMLPWELVYTKSSWNKWRADKQNNSLHREEADTEADARALCLIYLLENGLLKL